MGLDKEGQKAVHAVRQKVQKKFFSDKISVSMHVTDMDKDVRAKDNLQEGETYTDRNGSEWIRENGTLRQTGETRLNLVNPMFCPKCKQIMGGKESKANSQCYMKYSHCFSCQLKFEKELKLAGKFDEWLEERVQANRKAYLRDAEQAYEEMLLQDPEVEQFVMNGTGELETWIKDKEWSKKQQIEVKEYIDKLREKVNKGK